MIDDAGRQPMPDYESTPPFPNQDMDHGGYRSQLEQQVNKLQKQLQEEIDLHRVLASALDDDALSPSRRSRNSCKLPDNAREVLANIAALEIAISDLEEELTALSFQLNYERNRRRLFETCLSSSYSSSFTWEQHISFLRDSKFSGSELPHLLEQDLPSTCKREEMLGSCKGTDNDASVQKSIGLHLRSRFLVKKLWHYPNQLSEEMLRCMRDIFLCLSDSSSVLSDSVHSRLSPVGHLSLSSVTSFSDSSITPSLIPELLQNCEAIDLDVRFDPYGVNGKANWKNIGSYSLAAEVSWMSVGKQQLEYAAEALKRFRCLVEQLIKVNPARLNNKERLAFWINLYNTLIMHAYLAYGVPRSDIKLFALMQKASYSVGGQSFSAAEIEYVILKMKPPSHRPQIALILALHKFKISEEHRKYSIDSSEPLAVFALSSGMYSSPAVKVFSGDNVDKELHNAKRDYIRASVGISDTGKLLVPKLLHSYTKGVVEDSLLVDWICRYLTSEQVAIVRDFTTQKKQRLLSVRSFILVAFDSRFRYLYLPEGRGVGSSSGGGAM